ncbi:hypothetical protein CVS40_11353 [Lucilia cuprina]|nr:hypothetical protein CVS40_11353 [Lucilia cuprina]
MSIDEGPNLSRNQKENLENLLNEQQEIFENIVNPIEGVVHTINTGDHEPIATAPYRLSPATKLKLRNELDKMLDENVIEETESPWAFPVVLIPKKDGKF